MRRPLFALCLCLVSLAALGTIRGGPEKGRGAGAFSSVTEGELLRVTGYVYQKEAQKIYLKDVSVQDSAANLQQKFSANQKYKTDLKLVCQWKDKDISKDDLRNIPLGCRVLVEGSFRHFSRASNPGEFDREQYGRILGIEGSLTDASLLAREVCSTDGPGHLFCRGCSPVQEGLQRLKEYWKQRLYCILPEKEASVMSTMLLGDKADLDRDIKRLYKNNGIVHILSISGVKTLNLALLGGAKKPENWAFLRVHRGKIYIKKWQF